MPYLVVFGSGVLVLVGLVGNGASYVLVGPPVLVLSALVVIALERWRPYAEEWQRDLGDARTDRMHLVANVLIGQASAVAYTLAPEHIGVWPREWPFALQFVVALLIVDLGLYGVHRASHGNGWLWRLHAIHHSPRRVYWMNGQRRHVLHELLEGAPGLIALYSLGAPASVFSVAIAAVSLHLLWQHANVQFTIGPFRYLFAVAEVHRWHHQRRWQDVQGSYAAVLAFWDHLFGTALPQSGPAPLDVGMDDEPDLPEDWLGQHQWPFRRRQ